MQESSDKLLGRYKKIGQLGGGSFGITHLAEDTNLPSYPKCVVKELRPNRNDEKIIDFFDKEAAILEKLGEHSQIPRLLAYFEEENTRYIVQEFIEGHDLSKEILPREKLSEGYVKKLLQEVLEVLSFVHQNEVIHRDIKPKNLMRRYDGKIFLIDFGAVKELGSLIINSDGEVSSTDIIGTPGYMPNEQSLGKPCFASDIYAVGVTAIFALTGVPPSKLEENPQTGEVIWPDQVQVSQNLREVITKMVRRHFSNRYSSAYDALKGLTTAAQPAPQNLTTTAQPVPQTLTTTAQPVPQSLTTTAQPTPHNQTTPTSPTPATKLSLPTNLSRRKALQIFGFAGGSFLLTVVGKILLDSFSSNLKTFDFEVVTVNRKGETTNRKSGSAKYFIEDLGNDVSLEMVEIPAGSFEMGSPVDEEKRIKSESPQHKVNIKPFFMGKFAVTQAQYQEIMSKNPSYFKGDKRPVEKVSWNDATEFCDKLTQRTGRAYRLPSEAEWEYACRAGTTTPFHFGETITTDLVNYNGDYTYADASKGEYRKQTIEVESFPPNTFGLYDMHGNISEWCQDTWHSNYNDAPSDGSAWIDHDNDIHVLRGGGWQFMPAHSRSAFRLNNELLRGGITREYIGFRVVYSL